MRARIRRALDAPSVRRRVRPVRWGNLRRLRPFSARFGFDRGTPIDRYYLDAFFRTHAHDITGRVLEVKNPEFSGRFGHDVTRLDLVDIDPSNDDATIIADLADAQSLPARAFDCAIVPQTLQFVDDVEAAIANAWQSIAPGGVLLVTIPAVSKRDHHLAEIDRWRLLPAGLAEVLRRRCPGAEVELHRYGNLLTATGFLQGVAAEELTRDELDARDDEYPILTCGRARRPVS